ncbi:hypothetical protein QVD17_31243 [Tagetes erecta]|uniref:Secreted protein n=1 Tax=Tagetes erecta TaxID=13708 RepID=A0AAD8K5V7_TARER|nr:hypothetical protein QVD17_31243 [Tagetes erecta]
MLPCVVVLSPYLFFSYVLTRTDGGGDVGGMLYCYAWSLQPPHGATSSGHANPSFEPDLADPHDSISG